MSSTTDIKFQYELEDLLADNTTKAISAQDVRTIVTSNYQPVLIFAGRICSNLSGSWNPNIDVMRTQYYNQEYFGSNFINANTSPWVIDDAGNGITDGTYKNVPLVQENWNGNSAGQMNELGGNSTPATFDVEVVSGIVQPSNITLKAPGAGWIGKSTASNGSYNGQTGRLQIDGNTSAVLRFNGPLIKYYDSGDGKVGFNMSTSTSNSDHTVINTIISSVANEDNSTQSIAVTLANISGSGFGALANNKLAIDTNDNGAYIQIWLVAQ